MNQNNTLIEDYFEEELLDDVYESESAPFAKSTDRTKRALTNRSSHVPGFNKSSKVSTSNQRAI